MASAASRELSIGKIIDKTLAVLERSVMPALIYFVVLTVIDCAITWYALDMTAPRQALSIGLLKALVGIIAAYLLLSAMIRGTGLHSDNGKDVFLPYMGLSLLYVGAVLIGFILLIIPGLFLVARWILAQPLVVARGDGVMQAFGESWERTRGNEFQILVAMLALLGLFILIVIACSVMLAKDNMVGIVIAQLASSAMSVTSLAMGVALYGLMIGTAKPAS